MRALLLLLLPLSLFAQSFSKEEIARWQQQARSVTIIRDNWGIPHVYGKTDADAVFGLLYAQCEDDFARVEMNYIEKLGRKSEVFGEKELYNDLYVRLIIDSAEAVADYRKAQPSLKKLLQAYADGINFYLHTHKQVKPVLITRFKPWYPLLWTDGSIGAISTGNITAQDVKQLFSGEETAWQQAWQQKQEEPTGSNGFAVAPSKTESGKAILYINPHTTFYFRPEVHAVSEEGLNAYGAVTWGQFFVYQGFNEYCGWMHTSSNADVSDMYTEQIEMQGSKAVYRYAGAWRPVTVKKITIGYLQNGAIKTKTFATKYTHHGPVMAKRNGQYLSVRANNRSMNGLVQSWQRTKAKGLEDYKKVMDLRVNTSNNTVFADRNGNIAYWHGNFMPVRDTAYNWSKPVDGTTTATEWKGLHKVSETVHVINPATGWIQNCNSTPYTVSGSSSPKRSTYPPYMAPDGENFRGINAARVLERENRFTLDKMIAAGYDNYLSAFEILVPALVQRYAQLPASDSLRSQLAEPVAKLKAWDYRSNVNSVATTLAVHWAERLAPVLRNVYIDQGERDQVQQARQLAATARAETLLKPLAETVSELGRRFGTWKIPWGDINRMQRINNSLELVYDDNQPSVGVGFASATWGMLPSYNSRTYTGTQKRYGYHGNSFVCAVEFGDKVKAKSVLAGGNSGNPSSPHFADQLAMYATGRFKDVLFYKDDVQKHAERSYHPGQ